MPRFAPAYEGSQCSPFGSCAPASRVAYSHRVSRQQSRHPQYSSFNGFLSQVGELLSEMDCEAQRQAQLEAHVEAQREALRQRQQRTRTLRANFTVSQNDQGWQVDGDVQGFARENINIEIINEHTLKIMGNTHWQPEKPQAETQQSTKQLHTVETVEAATATDSQIFPDSDNESHKSYQPTVEDDYEDLGVETSSLASASSGISTPAKPVGLTSTEKAVEQPTATESPVLIQQSQAEAPAQVLEQRQPEEQDRLHGTFERTFRFPQRIDATQISANFMDGALRITIPKAQVPQMRRIVIL